MPCYDPQAHETRTVYKDGYDPEAEQEINRLRGRCDELTDLLCKAGRARYYTKTDIPVEVLEWWESHMEFDRSRGEPW